MVKKKKVSSVDGFVSIDISKDTLEVKLSCSTTDDRPSESIPNNYKGWQSVLRSAKKLDIDGALYVCMEATGSYWKKVAEFFYKKGAVVFVVNPARIKAQRKTEQKRSKTDKIDAGVIMRFLKANVGELRPWSPPSKAVTALQDLVRFREFQVRRRASLKTLLKSKQLSGLVLAEAEHILDELDGSIKKLEDEVARIIASDDTLTKQQESAISVLGVGAITSAVLMAECRAFKEISEPRQATAFAGLDVMEESSGKTVKPPHISHQGSALLRKTFVCASASAIKAPGVFRDFYQRLRAKGLKKKQAQVAVARKLLEITVAVVLAEGRFDRTRNCPATPTPTTGPRNTVAAPGKAA